MTRNKRRPTFPEILAIALLACGAAWLLHRPAPEEAKSLPSPGEAETVSMEETMPDTEWNADMLYDALRAGIDAGEETVSFPWDCGDALFDVFHRVLADHPEFFWLTGSGSYRKSVSDEGVSVEFTPEVLLDRGEIDRRREALEVRAEEILEKAREFGTVYEQLVFLHNLLVDDTDYDAAVAGVLFDTRTTDEISRSTGAYGCLVDRRAVCSGYAAAFQLLCGRLDIPCVRVQGTETKSGSAHEWNLVELDGEWYHVDVTWDDPLFSGEPVEGYRSYDYFCVSTAEIARNHVFDVDSIPLCASDTYNYYRVNGLTLAAYDPDAAAKIIARQVSGDGADFGPDSRIWLKFPDEGELSRAVDDLIAAQKIFHIPAVKETGARSLRYVDSEMGTLCVWLLP